MKKMKIEWMNRKNKKRIASFVTALAVCLGSLPVSNIAEQYDKVSYQLRAWAVDGTIQQLSTITKFRQYVENYGASNINDTLYITFGSDDIDADFECDSIAQTQNVAFNGKIILGAGMKINMVHSMFGYVTDNVEIVDASSNDPTQIVFRRPSKGNAEPLFAQHVIHTRTDSESAEWSFGYSYYPDGNDHFVCDVGGFIGSLGENSKVEITSITFNNTGTGATSISNITAFNNEAGLICSSMDTGSQLTVDSVTCTSPGFNITAGGSSGNAGGLVGFMESDSKLILSSTLTQFQDSSATISAPKGYAGGIVGKCDGGIIEINAPASGGTNLSSNSNVLAGASEDISEEETTDSPSESTEANSEETTTNTETETTSTTEAESVSVVETETASSSESEQVVEITANATEDTTQISESAAETDATIQNEATEEVEIVSVTTVETAETTENISEVTELTETTESASEATVEIEETSETVSEPIVKSFSSYLLSGSPQKFKIVQKISGASGSGGVAGYYKASSANNNTFSSVNLDLETGGYQVNNAGECGGLFGEVFNNGQDMTITAASVVKPNHASDTASSYGGLIGKYTASALNKSLTITGTSEIHPQRIANENESLGNARKYGGVIGNVDKSGNNSAYVKINGITVNAETAAVDNPKDGSSYFGGVIGCADEAFIELAGTNTISYSGISKDKNFAGVVGSLETGVLYLCDTTDLSGAASITAGATSKSGQIVGYRNCGFVFAKSGWKLYRCNTGGQKVDDIGSWGEVIRFNDSTFKQTDVITHDVTNHYITIKGGKNADINTVADFATTALNAQLNDGKNTNVIKFARTDHKDILSSRAFTLKQNTTTINLIGTGLTGLTRDNTADAKYSEYSNATGFDGKSGSIILAIGEPYGYIKTDDSERAVIASDVGCGKIYRHKYNGLFAKAKGTTVKNLTISKDSIINVEACAEDMNVGPLVAYASGALTLDKVNVGTSTDQITINHAGNAKNFCVGGFVGKATSKITIGTSAANACVFNGKIQGGGGSNVVVGGVIGYISGFDASAASSISNTTVSGEIKSSTSASDQQIGGLVGVISGGGKKLNLNTVTISGLTVDGTATASCGGLLGYNWNKTEVDFTSVQINSSSTVKTSAPNVAGLVYKASGWWKVNANGITFNSAEIKTNASVDSLGLLVNKGCYSSSALYLELLSGGLVVGSKSNVALSKSDGSSGKVSVGVFDELVAYSRDVDADKNITENGQGIVSINTGSSALLKMDDSNSGLTYENKTGIADNHTVSKCNPNTRYYYNLDAYRTNNTNTAAQKFLIWSVRKYAHSTIQGYFTAGYSGNTVGEANADLNMRGYSYYPINVEDSVTISGNVKLYNAEFDTSAKETRLSYGTIATNTVSQHYTMHNSLFNNVTGTLTAQNLTLDGDVSKITGLNGEVKCGALIMGTVSSQDGTAQVAVNGLVLKGIKINDASSNGYAPLLINNSGSNATFNIKDVSADTGYDPGAIIGSSLIGDLGSYVATAVQIVFSEIKLDGRKTTITSDIDDLKRIYGTNHSLFSRATLLNSFAYSDNSSYGNYNYAHSVDWGDGGTPPRTVTYGAEITNTVEFRDTSVTPSVSRQNKYHNSSSYYTHPTNNAWTTGEYDGFKTNYQNYVYTGYNETNRTHELQVNISAKPFSGCGTYNDPYMIVSDENLVEIAKIINGTSTGFTIDLPSAVNDSTQSVSWCSGTHNTFTTFAKAQNGSRTESKWSTGTGTEITDDTMAYYLAHAYYKIDANTITLPSTYPGISYNVADKYVFCGVIDGNGKTITNKSSVPLIISSNGCVVEELTVNAQPTSAMTLATKVNDEEINSKTFTAAQNGCQSYGAVIGQILGGDNIIDDVTVSFTGTVVDASAAIADDTTNYRYAQNVPIGGYVGVVVDGALIFRNMNQSGRNYAGLTSAIAATALTGFGVNPISSSQWLYVNPIVGRVINGYAVTVSDSYKYSESNVTMKNSTKNYSIADINPSLAKLSVSAPTSQNSGVYYKSTVTIPNAQALFILSLLTQSSTTVGTAATSPTLGSSDSYDLTYKTMHIAQYNSVGKNSSSYADYSNLAQYDGVTSNANLVPYIVKYYVDNTTSSSAYSLCLTSSTMACDFVLGGNENDPVWNLPDGFRGIGNIGFGMTNASDMNTRTINLKKFNGKNTAGERVNIHMNMSLTHYEQGFDNYPPIKVGSSGTGIGGFGLFNKLHHNNLGTAATTDIISELDLSGTINYYVFDHSVADGKMVYNYTYVEKPSYLHVGGLAGSIGSGTSADTDTIVVQQIGIGGLTVNGFESAGGFFGYLKMAASPSGEVNISNVTAETAFTVTSKRYAGGLIGYFGQGNLIVNKVTIINPNILTYYHGKANQDFTNGAGGIVGFALNDSSNSPILLSIIQLGALKSESEDPSNFSISSRIGYAEDVTFNQNNVGGERIATHDDTIVAGGLIGRSHTKVKSGSTYSMELTNCNVYNVNVYGHKVGGLLGSDIDKDSKIHIVNCKVISDTDEKSQIYGLTIDAKDRGCGGIIGGNSNVGLFVDDCQIQGYILQGRNDTAGVCAWEDAGTLTIHNLLIKDIVIRSDYSGSLVGYQNAAIEGYNILTDNVQFQDKAGGIVTNLAANKIFIGYLVGKNLNARSTKIVGLSRQNTSPKAGYFVPDRMTGNTSKLSQGSGCADSTTSSYGGGYIIFSDYNGASIQTPPEPGTAFSDFHATANVTAAIPYVTCNPYVIISASDAASPQILTGDAVSNTNYADAAAGSIISDIQSGTEVNRYQNTGLDATTIAELDTLLSTKISSFKRELNKTGVNHHNIDFPVLIIDDIDTVNTTIPNYIKLLTNTAYAYTGANGNIYDIKISRMVYDEDTKQFKEKLNSSNKPVEAALKYNSEKKKYSITLNDLDNTACQFSLIDVQFKDPSDRTKIAYHLYIPVMVEKMLHYSFTASPASGTTYQKDAYPNGKMNLIENLGNPVTVKLSFAYARTAEQWAEAINNGENINRNYENKTVLINAFGQGFPTGSKLVLVDPNGNKDKMYDADFAVSDQSASTESESNQIISPLALTDSENDQYTLTLSDFSGFTYCKLNDLMKVSIDATASSKKLVVCNANEATVYTNDSTTPQYLRLATDTELENSNITKYAVKVTDWDGNTFTDEEDYIKEIYYLSIFTKEAPSDTTIYHYLFNAPQTFNDPTYPSARTNKSDVSHILLGNLYNNTVDISEVNTNSIISASNNYLEANLSARVGFKKEAIKSGITSYIDNENIDIYQTFLISLKKMESSATKGIVLKPECEFTYKVENDAATADEILESRKRGICMEFPTKKGIKQALCDKIESLNLTEISQITDEQVEDSKITITSNVTMSYDKYSEEQLVKQFPEEGSAHNQGTIMVGYSNISSSSENAASSRASDDTEATTNRRRYYMEDANPVKLAYNAATNDALQFQNDGNSVYGQLGINAHSEAKELTNDGLSPVVKSLISYNASEFSEKDSAEYVEIEVMLSNKTNYNTALNIPTYLDGFKLIDRQNREIKNPAEWDTTIETTDPRYNVSVDRTTTQIYTYVIPRSLVEPVEGSCEFEIPVEFRVYSGAGEHFERRTVAAENPDDVPIAAPLTYANYRVKITAHLLGSDKTRLDGSEAFDHMKYTNAKIRQDIVPASPQS